MVRAMLNFWVLLPEGEHLIMGESEIIFSDDIQETEVTQKWPCFPMYGA